MFTSRFFWTEGWEGDNNAKNDLSPGLGLNATDLIFNAFEPGVVYYIYGKLHMDSMNSLTFASN